MNGDDFDKLGDLLHRYGPEDDLTRPSRDSTAGVAARGEGSGGHRTAIGPDTVDRGRLIARLWDEIVGLETAQNSRPVQLRRGRLVVAVSSSAWAHTLQMMSLDIVRRINDLIGPETVERVVFRHAGWEE